MSGQSSLCYFASKLFLSAAGNPTHLCYHYNGDKNDAELCPNHHRPERSTAAWRVSGRGYTNLLQLDEPEDLGRLMLLKSGNSAAGQFALGARDILLFKKHPEATSVRNMQACVVRRIYETEWLDCQRRTLIAEIVPQSVKEMELRPGSEVVAVFKASAFRRLY